MPIDLHYICKRGENHKLIGEKLFETADWTVGKLLTPKVIGGRIFLHHGQKSLAWHGGTILGVHPVPNSKRKKIIYIADVSYAVLCPVKWAQEKAVAFWNDDRSELLEPPV